MGKQKKVGLGQALKANIRNTRHVPPSHRHTSGSATKDFATLHSCTQENDLDSFLRTADLANTDFTAEKLNLKVVTLSYSEAIPHPEEQMARRAAYMKHREEVRIPRRPPWTKEMSKEVLEQNERDAFIIWRKALAVIEENQHIILTPFEKNLEVWRQLWRVSERSDVVIQIVDARDPLFYWCTDLLKYVKEIDAKKGNILLVNKSDFLSDFQRTVWSNYFKSQGIKTIFYSAINELEEIQDAEAEESNEVNYDTDNKLDDEELIILSNFNKFSLLAKQSAEPESLSTLSENDESDAAKEETTGTEMNTDIFKDLTNKEDTPDVVMSDTAEIEPAESVKQEDPTEVTTESSISTILQMIEEGGVLTNSDLLTYLAKLAGDHQPAEGSVEFTIGLVGYPNVGKSCTLNSLLQEKRVQVSSTPGKTKHFQTFKLKLDGHDVMLCDCPGLVFPNIAASQSEMFCNGILPIDHMRDAVGPISHLIDKIPRIVLESVYGMKLPVPDVELEGARLPYAAEVLREYGSLRGFMTTHGTPDESRAARILLKDYVNGKLLNVKPPPDYEGPEFNPISESYMSRIISSAAKVKKTTVTIAKEGVEKNFFKPREVKMITNGRTPGQYQKEGAVGPKPWKKHFKGNSKVKTRITSNDLNY